ncbi:hypothetical protein AB8P51_14960 [Muriicola sp. SD30]|uniref:hypothetical protein n=1 Tax=Muriicola sp. SD30 TaxID=3240936 RepID=UPI003510602B
MDKTLTKHFAVGILLFAGLSSCNDGITKITDHYYLYETVDFDYDGNRIDGRNVLMCKLASKKDPFIENVLIVEWNSNVIIAKTSDGFYVIEGNSFGLKCSSGNKTIGPLTANEIIKLKAKINFDQTKIGEIKT